MGFRALVNTKVDTVPAVVAKDKLDKGSAVGPASQAVSAFMTPQTLTTFSGASMAIAVTDKVIDWFVPEKVANAPWPIALIAAGVGAFLIWMSLTDPALKLTSRERTIHIVVGIVNTLFLMAAALGIQFAAGGPDGGAAIPDGGGGSTTTATG